MEYLYSATNYDLVINQTLTSRNARDIVLCSNKILIITATRTVIKIILLLDNFSWYIICHYVNLNSVIRSYENNQPRITFTVCSIA